MVKLCIYMQKLHYITTYLKYNFISNTLSLSLWQIKRPFIITVIRIFSKFEKNVPKQTFPIAIASLLYIYIAAVVRASFCSHSHMLYGK